MSAIEYVLHWLKGNNPELYQAVVTKMAEAENPLIPVRIPRTQMQATE